MSPSKRHALRLFAAAMTLSLGTFSLSSASAVPGEVTATADTPRMDAAAAGLKASYFVRNTVTRIAKLSSQLTTGEGRFDSTVDAVKETLSGSITLPPTVNAYFVAFRFMPVTGTVSLTSEGEQHGALLKNPGDAGVVASRLFPDGKKYLSVIVDLTLSLGLRLSDTKVDGKTLDLGPSCTTASPLTIKVKGLTGLQNTAPPTVLTSTFDIPPFSGCGVRENLDRLLTGLISGPGNEMSTTIAVRCISSCPEG
ncbi:hypothetical protein CU254_15960 [Amycolatopsis sp. AA4]|uniref:hypothetical protein n=1 Tax=Actinomycetes TaxID=1760 RepID=UPI0001B5701B|nr:MULTISPECIES: hypothetical protein [Actinomycetes]ATY11794.1 hypothetical protein CU254_15960 [Amycolatopsis sp. AA4]EFL07464.1 hypothetical protein SSMG_03135 [Streptomyces sp. AA4]